jgi:hypothetical protein
MLAEAVRMRLAFILGVVALAILTFVVILAIYSKPPQPPEGYQPKI